VEVDGSCGRVDVIAIAGRHPRVGLVDSQVLRRERQCTFQQSLVDGAEFADAQGAEVDRPEHPIGVRVQEHALQGGAEYPVGQFDLLDESAFG